MSKIGILYICTGNYTVFWKDFFDSCEKYFLKDNEKDYIVFTDSDNIYEEDNPRVHKIYQEAYKWPYGTMMRYHMFVSQEALLKQYDYIFFMNANCLFVSEITPDEFLPKRKLVFVKHPGYYDKDVSQYTYDRNPKSTAYVADGQGKYYICGGVNGGVTDSFLDLSRTIVHNVDEDERNGVVALWHDESHVNKYIIGRNDYDVLSPAFCYAEGWKLPFEPKIIVRDKSKWINVRKAQRNSLRYYATKIKGYFKRVE